LVRLCPSHAILEARNVYGQTALHVAAGRGQTEVVKLLLAKGANALTTTTFAATALHFAAAGGHKDMVEPLLAHGADIDGLGCERAPIHMAMTGDQKEMVQFLIDKGAQGSPIHVAAYLGRLHQVQALLADGVSINAKDRAGFRPLHSAVCGNQREVAEFLIQKGADINAQEWLGSTPLLHASYRRPDMVELLIAKGAKVNLQNRVGQTPLHVAADRGWKEGVERFLAAGANTNVSEVSGLTPLLNVCSTVAYRGSHRDIAQLLIEKGADVNAKDKKGETALALAKERGRKQIVELLRKHGAKE